MILRLAPRDFSVLTWVSDEGRSPVYRVARTGIKAAKLAATIARKLMQDSTARRGQSLRWHPPERPCDVLEGPAGLVGP